MAVRRRRRWRVLQLGRGASATRPLSLIIALGSGAAGWLWGRQQNQSDEPERASSDLLVAVSGAAPVAFKRLPDDALSADSAFTIRVAGGSDVSVTGLGSIDSSEPAAVPPMSPQPTQQVEAKKPTRTETDTLPADTSTAFSTTILGDSPEQTIPSQKPTADKPEVPLESATDQREDPFVSIDELNEKMGPPAPEEEDDDEAGWLWWGDGVLAWFTGITAGLLASSSGGTHRSLAGEQSEEPLTSSDLTVSFLAGPFFGESFTLQAVGREGETLFSYADQSVGSVIGNGVTLTGVVTDEMVVNGQSLQVVTGLDVRFDDYNGPVSLQLSEVNGPAPEFIDEALGEPVDLDIPLRGFGALAPGERSEVVITPFTEAAFRLIESSDDFTEQQAFGLLERRFDSAVERVADLIGINPTGTAPASAIDPNFAANAAGDLASQYGLKLAALSVLSESAREGPTNQTVPSAEIEKVLDDLLGAVNIVVEPSDEKDTLRFADSVVVAEQQVKLTTAFDDFITDTFGSGDALALDGLSPAIPTVDALIMGDAATVISGSAVVRDTRNTNGDIEDLTLKFVVREAEGDQAIAARYIYEDGAFSRINAAGDVIADGMASLQFAPIDSNGLPDIDTAVVWTLALGGNVALNGPYDVDLIVRDAAAHAVIDRTEAELVIQSGGRSAGRGWR